MNADCMCRFTNGPKDPCDYCKIRAMRESHQEIKDSVFIFLDTTLLHRDAPISRAMKLVGRKDKDLDSYRERFLSQIIER